MNVSEIIKECSLNTYEKSEYEKYIANEFANKKICSENDTSFLEYWDKIYSYCAVFGAAAALNKYITPKRPVEFKDKDGVRIENYNSFVGNIPIVYIKNTDDFEDFVINSGYKGIRPDNLSQTGASFVFGKSTRFIILSAKPYSNVPACEVGLDDEAWKEKSMILRREHECTHYFTKQVFGVSRSNLHDELLADFFGIYEAFGEYKAEYFQKFMGIIKGYGGRLGFYTKNLSVNVFKAVEKTAVYSSEYLERYSRTDEFLNMKRNERVFKLCLTSLADMCE